MTMMFVVQLPVLAFVLSVVGLSLWTLVFVRVKFKLVHQRALEPEVRAAALVTLVLVLCIMTVTSLVMALDGSEDVIAVVSAMSRGVAIVGGAYALIGTFARQGEE